MRLNEVLDPKWPKNEVFGLLKKIESLDLAENGLKRCLLLLYNFSRRPHLLENSQTEVKWGFMPKNEVFGLLKKIESNDLAENGLEWSVLLLGNF